MPVLKEIRLTNDKFKAKVITEPSLSNSAQEVSRVPVNQRFYGLAVGTFTLSLYPRTRVEAWVADNGGHWVDSVYEEPPFGHKLVFLVSKEAWNRTKTNQECQIALRKSAIILREEYAELILQDLNPKDSMKLPPGYLIENKEDFPTGPILRLACFMAFFRLAGIKPFDLANTGSTVTNSISPSLLPKIRTESPIMEVTISGTYLSFSQIDSFFPNADRANVYVDRHNHAFTAYLEYRDGTRNSMYKLQMIERCANGKRKRASQDYRQPKVKKISENAKLLFDDDDELPEEDSSGYIDQSSCSIDQSSSYIDHSRMSEATFNSYKDRKGSSYYIFRKWGRLDDDETGTKDAL